MLPGSGGGGGHGHTRLRSSSSDEGDEAAQGAPAEAKSGGQGAGDADQQSGERRGSGSVFLPGAHAPRRAPHEPGADDSDDPDEAPSPGRFSDAKVGCALIIMCGVVGSLVIIAVAIGTGGSTPLAAAPAEVATCVDEHRPRAPLSGRGNERLLEESPEWVVIRNCLLWSGEHPDDGGGDPVPNMDILIQGTAIQAVGADLSLPEGVVAVEHDAGGRHCTPGVVDMHSHAGVYGWPEVWAREDGNEMTDPTYPQVRAIDAFDPEDTAIPRLLAGGVTTVQVLPGSGNVMGGEGFIAKLRGSTVGEMYVPGSPRLLKMACGENPKRVYGEVGSIGTTPMSRMGSAWLMREKFEEAASLVEEQQLWCRAPEHTSSTAEWDPLVDHSRFPASIALDSLTALLRGEARLHVHCYEVEDLEMVVRLSQEFNFSVAAFHHALEAYKVPDLLRDNGITAATFSDLWGYKMEAYDASVHGPAVLHAAGARVALKSDHPVIDAHWLMMEAAKSRNYGLPRAAAMAAVTSVPADTIGMGGRVGRVKLGYDADVVVWDRDPLVLGAMPVQVFVNGELHVDTGALADGYDASNYESSAEAPGAGVTLQIDNAGFACSESSGSFAIVGAEVHTRSADGSAASIADATLVVEGGVVTCVAATESGACTVPDGADTYTLSGGHVVPGFVETLAHVGQLDIEAEDSTADGRLRSSGENGESQAVNAVDGIRMNSRHVRAAWLAGVTSAVSSPMGSQLIAGVSVAFHTTGAVVDDALVADDADEVALHINVGNRAKNGGSTDSVSGQFAALRAVFDAVAAEEDSSDTSAVARAVRGELPVVVQADQADIIAAALRFRDRYDLSMVIAGGAEAHVIANRIRESGPDKVSVLLRARTPPSDFERTRASVDAAAVLTAAGVRVGIGSNDPGLTRNLR